MTTNQPTNQTKLIIISMMIINNPGHKIGVIKWKKMKKENSFDSWQRRQQWQQWQ